MSNITVRTPAPKTRDEAWLAWESSLLKSLQKNQKFNKSFITALRKYLPYTIDIRYFRSEILVEDFEGNRKWIKVLSYTQRVSLWTEFKFTDLKFAQRQKKFMDFYKNEISELDHDNVYKNSIIFWIDKNFNKIEIMKYFTGEIPLNEIKTTSQKMREEREKIEKERETIRSRNLIKEFSEKIKGKK